MFSIPMFINKISSRAQYFGAIEQPYFQIKSAPIAPAIGAFACIRVIRGGEKIGRLIAHHTEPKVMSSDPRLSHFHPLSGGGHFLGGVFPGLYHKPIVSKLLTD